MVDVLVVIMIIGGLSGTMLMQAMGGQRSTSRSVEASKLLFVSEAGLDYNFVKMSQDPLYAVTNLVFQLDATDQSYVSPSLTLDAGGTQQSFQYRIQYLQAETPVVFADRSDPIEPFEEVKVTCTATGPFAAREVASWYSFEAGNIIQGAIVSDMTPTGTSGSGETLARKGHIVFDLEDGMYGHFTVFGDMLANGSMIHETTTLTDSNVDSLLDAHDGELLKDLVGTEDELPDFTDPGGDDQLFDFERYRAAAAAGAGQIFTSLNDFQTAMENANSVGDKLEGITVVEIDPAVEGASPRITSAELSAINITGTLVFIFADGTSPSYELDIETTLNINAADLSGWNRNNESTYTTGYPGSYDDPMKKPSARDITPAFKNFTTTDDYLALMMNNGVLDIDDRTNICGAIYTPSYLEIDGFNSSSCIQYFNGAIYTGGGICVQGQQNGVQAFRYDPNCVNRLQTKNGKGESLTRTGYAILK